MRGERRTSKLDGIFRAAHRQASTYVRARALDVADELRSGGLRVEAGRAVLVEARGEIQGGWKATGAILEREGRPELAAQVRSFLQHIVPPRTDKEQIAARTSGRSLAGGAIARPATR